MIFQPQAGSLLESTDTEPGRVWLFKSYLKSFRLSHAGISDSPVVMIYKHSEERSQKNIQKKAKQSPVNTVLHLIPAS